MKKQAPRSSSSVVLTDLAVTVNGPIQLAVLINETGATWAGRPHSLAQWQKGFRSAQEAIDYVTQSPDQVQQKIDDLNEKYSRFQVELEEMRRITDQLTDLKEALQTAPNDKPPF